MRSVQFDHLPVQALSKHHKEHRRQLMSMRTYTVRQGTCVRITVTAAAAPFRARCPTPARAGRFQASLVPSLDKYRSAGLRFPDEETEVRKKMGRHIWKELRVSPTSPTTELPCQSSWAGPERLPGPTEALATQATSQGVTATGQKVRLHWAWSSQRSFCLWSVWQPQAPGQGSHVGPLKM